LGCGQIFPRFSLFPSLENGVFQVD